MPNIRLVAANGKAAAMKVNGRAYSVAAGATIDAPDFDAWVLTANGFVAVAAAGVGTTAQRPAKPQIGQSYHDTTLAKNVVWEGAFWRDPATGSAV
jgi:hypothetical protein